MTSRGISTRERATALLVALCFFMEQLDGTIVSTAAPRLSAALGVPPSSVGLLIAVYLLTVVVVLPLSGWLSLRWGARRTFLMAVVVFTAASLGCGLATGFGQLAVMRVLQGIGGAFMVPVGLLVVLGTANKPDIPRLLSLVVWPGLIAPLLAPAIGGVITTYWNWRWIFLINVPLGVIAVATAWWLITPSPPPGHRTPFDLPGAVLIGLGLSAMVAAGPLTTSGHGVVPLVVLGAGVALLGTAARHLLRAQHPLVNLRALGVPTFRVAVVGSLLFGALVAAVPFLLPLLLGVDFGWSAAKSGAVVLFVFAGNIGIKPATTWLINHVAFRYLISCSCLGLAATAVAFALLAPSTPLPYVIGLAVVSGCARSIGLSGYAALAYSDTTPSQMEHCNTLLTMAQQMSGVLGVSAAAAALHLGSASAFALMATAGMAAALHSARLDRNAGETVRRARQPHGPEGRPLSTARFRAQQ